MSGLLLNACSWRDLIMVIATLSHALPASAQDLATAVASVDMTPAFAARLGIVSAPAMPDSQASLLPVMVNGIDPAPLIQQHAERAAAAAAHRASRAALARTRTLHAAQGSASGAELELAQSVEAQDAARLTAATQRLRSDWGDTLGGSAAADIVAALAAGSRTLLRLELDSREDMLPASAPLFIEGNAHPLSAIWPAPGNPLRPGGAWYALSDAQAVRPGERVPGQIELPTASTGVLIPRSALVLRDGKSYVYLVRDEHFDRIEVTPLSGGVDAFRVTAGVAAGDAVVVAGAALLLSAEVTAVDDDDDN